MSEALIHDEAKQFVMDNSQHPRNWRCDSKIVPAAI
jgi:hypothetical protein